VKLVFVALLASESAMLVNKRVEAKIGQAAAVSVSDVKIEPAKTHTAKSDFVPILRRNIFNSDYVYVEENQKGNRTASDTFELIGTIAWAEPYSMAVIKLRTANKIDVYRVGEGLEEGSTVSWIEPRRFGVDRNGHEEILELPEIRVAENRVSFVGSGVDAGAEGIKKVGEGQYVVSQDLFRDAFSNPAKLMRGIMFVPFFEKGGIAGFKVKKVKEDSIYGKLGFTQGDVLRQINGIELKGIDDIMSVMASMKDAHRFSLDLTREGQKKSFSYEVR
jgi:type II secretion system protein C